MTDDLRERVAKALIGHHWRNLEPVVIDKIVAFIRAERAAVWEEAAAIVASAAATDYIVWTDQPRSLTETFRARAEEERRG